MKHRTSRTRLVDGPRRRRAATLLAVLAALACTPPPTEGRRADAARRDAGEDPRARAVWDRSKVFVAVGEAHNMLPQETAMVKAAVAMRQKEARACFEPVVLRRGCRTGGIPASFDAMLMILTDGTIRDVRIVPNKNDLPRECHDAVNCIQDLFTGVQVQGLTRFEGSRQVYTTTSLVTPDESTLPATEGDVAP